MLCTFTPFCLSCCSAANNNNENETIRETFHLHIYMLSMHILFYNILLDVLCLVVGQNRISKFGPPKCNYDSISAKKASPGEWRLPAYKI